MPNYDEIIQQSQANVKSLGEKLKDLDKLHEDIKELTKQPEVFDQKYQQIVKLTEEYTNTLGAATKKYLDGNNILFTTKLSDLDKKTKDLEVKIIDLGKQIERLAAIDLEKHFDKLQKILSEIFGAINSINLTLTAITQTLTGIVQSFGAIQNAIETKHKEAKQVINLFSEATSKHLNDQDKEAKRNAELLENNIKFLTAQNDILKKEVKTNRIIQIIGLSIILIILIYLAVK
ncbi:MAG: hypothetical protein ABI638_07145 [Ignavibacteriota bacterium]